ncbi:lysophospholipid acyltransferase family protein [Sedimenticola sp.]|uniref:lysophospholipid acyltransferase family protein n=1 Tax=Sedimenticola sp. TaxID=1940285 RepID=UPI003D13FE3B
MSSTAVVVPSLLIILLLWQLYRLYRACCRANRVDWGRGWMNLLDGLNRLFCYRYHRLNLLGIRLPRSGPAIVVANHVSGLDPLLLLASSRRPLRFIIAREEYERFGLNWLFRAIGCIPVDRQKRPEQALREALRCLRKGEVVALFPHGKIHLDSDPPRRIKAGAIRLSQITGAPVLPHRISGIRGAGGVISGVLLRSRARIRAHSPIYPEEWGKDQLYGLVQGILDGGDDREAAVAI